MTKIIFFNIFYLFLNSYIQYFEFASKKNYIQEVIKADFKEAGDQDVFRKLKEDLKSKNIPDDEIRKKMDDLNEKAKTDFS